MRIAVTGSIATDHLMTFDGLFADSLLQEQLTKISVSFLASSLDVRRGGVAANISYGLGRLGLSPLLVNAVGEDFADYRAWLSRHGVDCSHVKTSTTRHTARFVCTTDKDQAQMATFYPGAMEEARDIELAPIADAVGGLDLVLIGAGDPVAMQRHAQECRQRNIPFAADPSQQLAFMSGDDITSLIEGATYLFSNEYEAGLIAKKTGWDEQKIADAVEIQVTTKGKDGAVVKARGAEPVTTGVALVDNPVDPTGVGDAFRAGFLAGLSWGLEHADCSAVGSVLASYSLEAVGPQEYDVNPEDFLSRLTQAFGSESAEHVRPHLSSMR